jgi:hypothetical protein
LYGALRRRSDVTSAWSSGKYADLVRETKKAVSAWRKGQIQWQEGYGAFSVGRYEEDAMVAYIRNQEEHHKKESSADELRRILQECGIEYDPRFFE